MKFFMMSKCGEGCGLLEKIRQEGNRTRLYISEKDYYSVYEGILKNEKTCNPEEDEIVIFDSSSFGEEADRYRRKGIKVFGASGFHDKLENSRNFGLEFMQECGIDIPDTYQFKSTEFGKAFDFLNSPPNEGERFVFKPSGDLPSHLTYVGEDSDELTEYMHFVEGHYGKEIKDFVLQKFVEGALVSSEFWMGPGGFIRPANQTIELKKFMNDDLGPSTGCSGNLVWRCDDSKILERGILRAEKKLVNNGFVGPIDLNTIVNENGVFGLEWTPRFGLDAMPSFIQLIKQDIGGLISDIVKGQTKEMKVSYDFAAGVRLSIPPYPLEPPKAKLVQEVQPNLHIPLDLPEEYEKNYYLYEVMVHEGELVHSDGTGVIAVVSCTDQDSKKAFAKSYEILEEICIPEKQYRTDLGDILPKMYEEVKEEELCLS